MSRNRLQRSIVRLCGAALMLFCAACKSESAPTVAASQPDAGVPEDVEITATASDTRFVSREHFIAAGEMQLSGEPLAEAMQRTLKNYSRDHIPVDLYFDTSVLSGGPWIDLTGYSTAIESYEYSKQPMNEVALEMGGGTSLVYGPLVNESGAHGMDAVNNLASRVALFAKRSNAYGRFSFPAGTYPTHNPRSGNYNPTGAGMPAQNPLGWPGIWPTTHVFEDFDPTIAPVGTAVLSCTITSDDDVGGSGNVGSSDYECDPTSMHLVDRAAQSNFTITPGADGFSGWKYGLWTLNYLQVMHDATEAGVSSVVASDLANVGADGNVVVGADDTGAATGSGTFLGSSDIEGFQAAMFIEEMDNRAEDWVRSFATSDGASLQGFASSRDALSYDYSAPLKWFPSEISVTESDDASGFPRPVFGVKNANSDLLDLIGLAMGYAEFYSLTDTNNVDVGGSQPAVAYFDGDPFAADNQLADGQASLHDRALAVMRVALVNIDRLHTDQGSGYLVDTVSFAGAVPTRGHSISTTSAAYSVIGLRTSLRALSSQLELYSNNTPDAAIVTTPLDALPIRYPTDFAQTFSRRMSEVMKAQIDLLYSHLTDASGRAYTGWDVAANAPVDRSDSLDAHTAAIRGLFAGYLATGETRYRDRAIAVFHRMESVFYDVGARVFTSTPGPMDDVEFTPLRFALLQSALRDVYELVASRPGGETLELDLESQLGRLNKLVLNGWNDRNENRVVDWPDECVHVVDSLPRGGLQMAERSLSGEIGCVQEQLQRNQVRTPTSDREHDCVPEVDDAKLPAALAKSITLHIVRSH